MMGNRSFHKMLNKQFGSSNEEVSKIDAIFPYTYQDVHPIAGTFKVIFVLCKNNFYFFFFPTLIYSRRRNTINKTRTSVCSFSSPRILFHILMFIYKGKMMEKPDFIIEMEKERRSVQRSEIILLVQKKARESGKPIREVWTRLYNKMILVPTKEWLKSKESKLDWYDRNNLLDALLKYATQL